MTKKTALLPALPTPRGDDSDSDGGLEKKPAVANGTTAIVEEALPAPKPVMGRPRIEGVERDPVSDRIKRPRPPPSEKQLEVLRAAREKRAEFVKERQRVAAEAKEKMKKIGVTKAALEEKDKEAKAAKEEAEKAKVEAEKLKAALEEEKKKAEEEKKKVVAVEEPRKRTAAPPKKEAPKKKAKYESSSSDDSTTDDDSSSEDELPPPAFRIRYI